MTEFCPQKLKQVAARTVKPISPPRENTTVQDGQVGYKRLQHCVNVHKRVSVCWRSDKTEAQFCFCMASHCEQSQTSPY